MVKKMFSNVFAVFVIFIILALIIPLNSILDGALLDFLLLVNIGLSLSRKGDMPESVPSLGYQLVYR